MTRSLLRFRAQQRAHWCFLSGPRLPETDGEPGQDGSRPAGARAIICRPSGRSRPVRLGVPHGPGPASGQSRPVASALGTRSASSFWRFASPQHSFAVVLPGNQFGAGLLLRSSCLVPRAHGRQQLATGAPRGLGCAALRACLGCQRRARNGTTLKRGEKLTRSSRQPLSFPSLLVPTLLLWNRGEGVQVWPTVGRNASRSMRARIRRNRGPVK